MVGHERTRGQSARGRLLAVEYDPAVVEAYLPPADWLGGHPLEMDPADPTFAPPALTNQWASLVAGRDVFAYAGLNAPPFYSASAAAVQAATVAVAEGREPLADHQAEPQAELYLASDGESLQAGGGLHRLVYRWYPGRILRSSTWRGLQFDTLLALSVSAHAVLQRLRIRNPLPARRRFHLYVRVLTDVCTLDEGFRRSNEPRFCRIYPTASGAALVVEEDGGTAQAVAGGHLPPRDVATYHPADPRWDMARHEGRLDGRVVSPAHSAVFHYVVELPARGTWELRWVHALGSCRDGVEDRYLACQASFDRELAKVDDAWQAEWLAAFQPGSGRFSGHLPVLQTDEESVRRLYYMGVMTLLYCKRTPRWGRPGVGYVTGLPASPHSFRPTAVYAWDALMVAGILSLVDPEAVRRTVERWLAAGLDSGNSVDLLTGRPDGHPYAVNRHAFIRMVHQYVRYTGDSAWLRRRYQGRTLLDHLMESAIAQQRGCDVDGLTDFGGRERLLECVSAYTHKVAAFNAARVWDARAVADLLQLDGRQQEIQSLRASARRLARRLLDLYVPGAGFWTCRQPDGSHRPVRHCLDFIMAMECIFEDLDALQRDEMVRFFLSELRTPTWMHALSPQDPDAAFSSRTDHQDEGAYGAWPAYCLEALIRTGHPREALDWMGAGPGAGPGLAGVTLQGPFGQAYFHGGPGSPLVAGAAAKAPLEPPHVEKPVIIAGGRYAELVLEFLAGLVPHLDRPPETSPPDLPFALTLHHVHLHGTEYRLSVEASPAC